MMLENEQLEISCPRNGDHVSLPPYLMSLNRRPRLYREALVFLARQFELDVEGWFSIGQIIGRENGHTESPFILFQAIIVIIIIAAIINGTGRGRRRWGRVAHGCLS